MVNSKKNTGWRITCRSYFLPPPPPLSRPFQPLIYWRPRYLFSLQWVLLKFLPLTTIRICECGLVSEKQNICLLYCTLYVNRWRSKVLILKGRCRNACVTQCNLTVLFRLFSKISKLLLNFFTSFNFLLSFLKAVSFFYHGAVVKQERCMHDTFFNICTVLWSRIYSHVAAPFHDYSSQVCIYIFFASCTLNTIILNNIFSFENNFYFPVQCLVLQYM
jgi:hypothetical protein